MKAKITSVISVTLCLIISNACVAPEPENFKSLHLSQPKVLQIAPPPDSILNTPIQISLNFSQRLDIETIDEHSIVLISESTLDPFFHDFSELMDDILDEKIELVPLRFELLGDEQSLTIRSELLPTDGIYFLVVTPLLKSVDGVPFNQKPGSGPEPFLARYGFGQSISLNPEGNGLDGLNPPTIERPDFLLINEVLYDGKASETDGEVFIEIYGTPGTNISNFEIQLLNGSNGTITDRIVFEEGTLLPDDGIFVIADLRTHSTTETRIAPFHYLDQFDPQNGPDALMLRDDFGEIWDALWYGTGAVALTPEGDPLGEGQPALDALAGQSLSRSEGVDTNENAQDFKVLEMPSPGIL